MTRLWKRGVNLCTAGLLGIGLFVGSLLLLGWLPTEAALPEEDAREMAIQPAIEEAIPSCLKVDVGDLVIDVIGYQDQGDGTTKILYWVTNTGEGALKEISFGTGGGKPVEPADGSIYSGGMGDYKVTWSDGSINFALQEQKDERQVSPFDVFTVLVRDFDSNSEIQVASQIERKSDAIRFRLNKEVCRGNSRVAYQYSKESVIAQKYVARMNEIPLENLRISNDHLRVYPNLERKFQMIVLLDTSPDGHFHRVMIDKNTGEITNDISAINKAEEAAYVTRYGKMEMRLYERLQEIHDSEKLLVAVWINGASAEDETTVWQSVADRFPEARNALNRGDKLWAVENEEIRNSIKKEYEQALTERTERRLRPMLDLLQQKYGVEVTTYGSMPALSAKLVKQDIFDLESYKDVGMIYLMSEQLQTPTVDIAIPTDRAPLVWDQNIDGTGARLAILENGRINSALTCVNPILTRGTNGFQQHKTIVASIAACDENQRRGMASGADILDADTTGFTNDSILGLQWALESPRNAHIVTQSEGHYNGSELTFFDRAFDYWARNQNALLVAAAGNSEVDSDGNTGTLVSPTKGWNVLTVGGSNDQDSLVWSDDTIYDISVPDDSSSYINPNSAMGDREKPEIIAPAVNIRARLAPGFNANATGTSFAAPQVAGLAALLIDRTFFLNVWPEAMRAIIMASATNNIVGPRGIPTGANTTDLSDGAGAINAEHADNIAQNQSFSGTCNDSCWWGASASNMAIGTLYTKEFTANRGEYIRIANSWWSQADGPTAYSWDRLDINLDLRIQYENSPNNWVDVTGANSASEDNNYELIEFVVENTGTYRVVTEKVSVQNTDNGNYVGTALLKLPYGAGDVNCDGMVSTVDALYIIQSDIGTRPFDSTGTCANYPSTNPTLITACDVSKASSSTPCDTSDALFILQCDVGISNALCPTNRDNYSIYIPDF